MNLMRDPVLQTVLEIDGVTESENDEADQDQFERSNV